MRAADHHHYRVSALSPISVPLVDAAHSTAYLIDCYKPQAAISSTSLFFARQCFAFSIPFYNFAAAEALGFTPWFGIQFALAVLSGVPALFLFRYGARWRERWGKPTFHDEL